jgi:hypothetical protein
METCIDKKLLTFADLPLFQQNSGTIGLAPAELISGDAPTETTLLNG